MAKKIQLQDANGNVLHPLTLGECVTMDNGENLDTLMSKSQMFTPTITQDKSMFKVGTGIDVDYGANVKDGAYESLVFKGKSLVNLLTKTIDTTWNLNLESWSIVSTVPSDCVLKPSTTYSVIVYVTEKTCPDRDDLFWVGDVDGKKDKITHDIVRKNVSLGANVFVINTVPDFSSVTSAYRGGINFQGSKFVEGTLKWKVIVLEGDWTNKELPPYFTGICDSKMPILRNVGKNLFDLTKIVSIGNATLVENSDKTFTFKPTGTGNSVIKFEVDLKKNKTYMFQGQGSTATQFRNSKNEIVCNIGGDTNKTITPSDDITQVQFHFGTNGSTVPITLDLHSVMISESSTVTTYEPYKTNILRTSEEIVLREVNGVQDTYNPLTGEYVQRIGEIVLDGSEGWGLWKTETPYLLFEWHSSLPIKNGNTTSVILADKLPVFTGDVLWNSSESRGIGSNENRFRIRIECETAEALKSWLQSNPITVQYELAEPVTTIVKPSTMTPFAYQNGHVIVESGFEGQSLLPEIEYSVVTGRTGQVTQNTKVLRQQEQQIIGLEELLLTQVVQMEYERTLLQFDYELQMMMLG